jgi:hypothetical protein
VEELLSPAHAADATGVTVEVTISWQVTVGYATERAEVGCKLGSAVEASATLGQVLQLKKVVADDCLQQLAWQGVILSLQGHIMGCEQQEGVLGFNKTINSTAAGALISDVDGFGHQWFWPIRAGQLSAHLVMAAMTAHNACAARCNQAALLVVERAGAHGAATTASSSDN